MKALVLLALLSGVLEDARFDEALAHYNAFRFEQAALTLQSLALDADAGTRSDEERAEIFVWLGLAQASLGEFAQARSRFADALELVPGLVLPVEVSPVVEELFAEVKAELEATPVEPDPPPPPPPEPDPPPPPVVEPPPVLLWTTAGAGAATLLASLVLTSTAVATASVADNPNAFQADARAALDSANVQIGLAYTGYAISAALLVGAGALFAVQ